MKTSTLLIAAMVLILVREGRKAARAAKDSRPMYGPTADERPVYGPEFDPAGFSS